MEDRNEIMVIDKSKIDSNLDRDIRKLLCECFPADLEFYSTSRSWHGSAPEYSIAAFNAGRVIAHVGIVVREISVGKGKARIAGIQNMSVAPEFRKSGIGPSIIEVAMSEALRRGISFSVLFCITQLERYYSKLGWRRIERGIRMDYDGKKNIDVPAKNICMVRNISTVEFPEGEIHLCGADW